VEVYKDCPPTKYLRHKIVGVSNKAFQPNNVYERQSYDKTTNKRFLKEMVETYHTHKILFVPPLYGMNLKSFFTNTSQYNPYFSFSKFQYKFIKTLIHEVENIVWKYHIEFK
jgi:hypothetical protein